MDMRMFVDSLHPDVFRKLQKVIEYRRKRDSYQFKEALDHLKRDKNLIEVANKNRVRAIHELHQRLHVSPMLLKQVVDKFLKNNA